MAEQTLDPLEGVRAMDRVRALNAEIAGMQARDRADTGAPPLGEVERIMRQIGTRHPRATRPVRRDELEPGMVFMSSHGYRLLISKVRDNATSRVQDRGVEVVGHLHASLDASTRTEIYPACSIVYVEQPELCSRCKRLPREFDALCEPCWEIGRDEL